MRKRCVREQQGEKGRAASPRKKNKFTSNITPYNAKTVYLSVYLPLGIESSKHPTWVPHKEMPVRLQSILTVQFKSNSKYFDKSAIAAW
jgi:hypothetical protein